MKGGISKKQLNGAAWLVSLYENGVNGVIADNEGLGKTTRKLGRWRRNGLPLTRISPTTNSTTEVAFIGYLKSMACKGPFLITAPSASLAIWMIQLKKRLPFIDDGRPDRENGITPLLYRGSEDRALLGRANADRSSFLLVVTSHETLMADFDHLQRWVRRGRFLGGGGGGGGGGSEEKRHCMRPPPPA